MTGEFRLDGRIALVTGSTGGIGREIARKLAADGATVLFHGRDRSKGRRAVEDVAADTGNDDLHLYTADLADTAAVREFAGTVRAEFDRVDALVNNAGTWQSERRLVDVPGCPEGVELTVAVNHLGHFLLTHCLADRLTAGRDGGGAGGADGTDPARVVVVASEVHRRAEMDVDALCGASGPSGIDAYALSKLANVMFTYELARRLPDGVTANCCHPGAVPATDLDRAGSAVARLGWRVFGLVGKVVDVSESPATAAETPAYLARSPDLDVTGAYFEECERTRSAAATYDRSAQRDLWERSAEWVDLADSETLPEG